METKKVLIADDDELLLGIYAKNLADEGLEVLTAGNGQEAWEIISAGNVPDLVFTGIIMPGMSGFELIQKIQADPRFSKVITAISSHRGRQEDKELAEKMGVGDFIIQGITTPAEVVVRIKALLGIQDKFKIIFPADKFDGLALAKFLNKIQATNLEPTAEGQIFLEIRKEEGNKFGVKLINE